MVLKTFKMDTNKQISIKAQNVNVSGQKKRNRRRRRRAGAGAMLPPTGVAGGGPMAPSGFSVIRRGTRMPKVNLSKELLTMDPSALSWFFKYLDPAGATESGRALGEFSKIPDGLCKFSVDAEMRSIYNEECPSNIPGSIPLDGQNWSCSIFSMPMFRFNYLVVCDIRDREITRDSLIVVLEQVNNLSNWKDVADSQIWNSTSDPYVFWKIRTNPPLADMPEPVAGSSQTVSDYRLTYKGVTIESNFPTLVNQGYWIGGQYAITPKDTPAETPQVGESLTRTGVIHYFVGSTLGVDFDIVDLTVQSSTGWSYFESDGMTHFSHPLNTSITSTLTFQLPSGKIFRDSSNNEVWADPIDVVSVTIGPPNSGMRVFTISSSRASTTPVAISHLSGTTTSTALYLELNDNYVSVEQDSSMFNVLEIPPSEVNQIAANNPKIVQYLCSESRGAYLVHSKIRNPVFMMASASDYGWVKFKTNTSGINHHLGGIRDTIDKNFSSAVASFRGISQSQTLIVKTYVGWEGLTVQNTPYGQFAHTGALENHELIHVSNQLATSLTGVYPAVDNFAAAVATFAATALSQLMKGESSTSVLTGLAQNAVNSGANQLSGALPGLIGGIVGVGKRLVARLRNRRR